MTAIVSRVNHDVGIEVRPPLHGAVRIRVARLSLEITPESARALADALHQSADLVEYGDPDQPTPTTESELPK